MSWKYILLAFVLSFIAIVTVMFLSLQYSMWRGPTKFQAAMTLAPLLLPFIFGVFLKLPVFFFEREKPSLRKIFFSYEIPCVLILLTLYMFELFSKSSLLQEQLTVILK